MKYPKVYLSIDNCFASKRWSTPLEWMELISSFGVNYIEVSADNEFDPLYSGEFFLQEQVNDIKEAALKTGVTIASLYSGHGTYSTLGMAHPSHLVREQIRDNWLRPMIDYSSELTAGLGFFAHAFSDSILQNESSYNAAKKSLYKDLSTLSSCCKGTDNQFISVEQMYSPHQIPYTIDGARHLIEHVSATSQNPFYITIDTGHQIGQQRFLKPSEQQLKTQLTENKPQWLGLQENYEIFTSKDKGDREKISQILENCERSPWLFAKEKDCDLYTWLEELGAYSPIIHLQQTDGTQSLHHPFTDYYNSNGIVDGKKVLKSIRKAYNNMHEAQLTAPCDKIYLTLEIFSGTAEYPFDLKAKIKQSVDYWRNYIPKDGLSLDELI